jgi:hypothetical protein
VKGGVFGYLAEAFGVLTLFFTFVGVPAVGVGGGEWLLVLPALLGTLALGGYLTGQDSPVPVAKQKAEVQAA